MSVQVPAAHCDTLLTKVGALVVFRNTCNKVSNTSVETQASIPAQEHLELIKGVVHKERVFAMVFVLHHASFPLFFLFKVLDGHLDGYSLALRPSEHLSGDNCF